MAGGFFCDGGRLEGGEGRQGKGREGKGREVCKKEAFLGGLVVKGYGIITGESRGN